MILTPAAEWNVIAVEPPVAPAALYTGYIIPLALIPAVCGLIANLFLSLSLHFGLGLFVVSSVVGFLLALAQIFIIAIIAQSLAPSFGGIGDRDRALKWIAYAYTPAWVAGVALIVPVLGPFVSLIGSLYSLYVLYLGTVPMMRVPQDKAVGYVVVIILIAIVLMVVIGLVLAAITAGSMLTSGGFARHY